MEAIGERLRKLREQLSQIESTSMLAFPKPDDVFSMTLPKSRKLLNNLSAQVSALVCQKFFKKWKEQVSEQPVKQNLSLSSDSDSDSFDENSIFEVQEKLREQLSRLDKISTSQKMGVQTPPRITFLSPPSSPSSSSDSFTIPEAKKSILRSPTSDRKVSQKHISFVRPIPEPIPSVTDLLAKASALRGSDDDEQIIGEVLILSSETNNTVEEEDSNSDLAEIPLLPHDVTPELADDEQINSISSNSNSGIEPESPIGASSLHFSEN